MNDGDAESASSYTMSVNVTAVNDAPTAINRILFINEDTAHTFEAGDFRFRDVDVGDRLEKVKIVTLPGAGSLTVDGTPVTANQEIARADIDDDKLVFTPAANASGNPYATIIFKVNDGDAESVSSNRIILSVNAANDAPTASDNTVATDEDTAFTFEASDFNFSDIDSGDTLARVKIVTLPGAGSLTNDGTPVTANQEIAKTDIDDDKLVFTPAADGNGDPYTSFTFRVNDGRAESASSYTMTVDVTAVPDAPAASDNTVATDEDTAYTFEANDFNFSDGDSGDTLATVKIVTLPGAGSLTNDGTPVTANQEIARADIDDDKLVFTPGRQRRRRRLCQLHLQGERRRRGERGLLHHDRRRDRRERRPHGV